MGPLSSPAYVHLWYNRQILVVFDQQLRRPATEHAGPTAESYLARRRSNTNLLPLQAQPSFMGDVH